MQLHHIDLADGVHDFGDTIYHVQNGFLHRDDGGPALIRKDLLQWFDKGFGQFSCYEHEPIRNIALWTAEQLQSLVEIWDEHSFRTHIPLGMLVGNPQINLAMNSQLSIPVFSLSLQECVRDLGNEEYAPVYALRSKYGIDLSEKVRIWYDTQFVNRRSYYAPCHT